MSKNRSKFQTKLEEIAVRSILGAIGLFPYKTSLNIGKFLGKTAGMLFPKLSKAANRNLEMAYPGISSMEKKRITQGTFKSLGRHLGFVSQFGKFTEEDIRKNIEVIGKGHFDKAYSTGHGILFFTGHFGSWEVFSLLSQAFGHKMNILVRRIENPLVEKYVDSLRTKFGNVTLGKKEAPRKMFRLLKSGEILGILSDLNAQLHDGVFVDFFGIPASTTTSIAKLALRTDAILLPAFAVWEEEKQKYVVYLERPIEFDKTGETEKDILVITQKITGMVEKYVRKYPEQWLWIHKRWNTRPRGEKDLY